MQFLKYSSSGSEDLQKKKTKYKFSAFPTNSRSHGVTEYGTAVNIAIQKDGGWILAGVAQLVGHHPANQKVDGSIPQKVLTP